MNYKTITSLLLFFCFQSNMECQQNNDQQKENTFSSNLNFTDATNALNIEMVFVKGGTFAMGCDSTRDGYCFLEETLLHQVTLSHYFIGKYEITQSQFTSKNYKIEKQNLSSKSTLLNPLNLTFLT